jgi:hypothetical protein
MYWFLSKEEQEEQPPSTSPPPSIWPLVKVIIFSALAILGIWSLIVGYQEYMKKEDYNKTQVALTTIEVMDVRDGISESYYYHHQELVDCIKSKIVP